MFENQIVTVYSTKTRIKTRNLTALSLAIVRSRYIPLKQGSFFNAECGIMNAELRMRNYECGIMKSKIDYIECKAFRRSQCGMLGEMGVALSNS